MPSDRRPPPIVKRVGERLHSVQEILDDQGQVIDRHIKPLMLEVELRDVAQMIVGALVLAIPVALAEEVWTLGATLPPRNVVGIALFSIGTSAVFVYALFYRKHMRAYRGEFFKRVTAVYTATLSISAMVLLLIGKLPLIHDPEVAIGRTVIVAFAASFAATVVDSLE